MFNRSKFINDTQINLNLFVYKYHEHHFYKIKGSGLDLYEIQFVLNS